MAIVCFADFLVISVFLNAQFLVAGFSVITLATAKKVHKHQTWVSYIGIEALIKKLEVVFCFFKVLEFSITL